MFLVLRWAAEAALHVLLDEDFYSTEENGNRRFRLKLQGSLMDPPL